MIFLFSLQSTVHLNEHPPSVVISLSVGLDGMKRTLTRETQQGSAVDLFLRSSVDFSLKCHGQSKKQTKQKPPPCTKGKKYQSVSACHLKTFS